ncbi:MAG: hypothetical protein NTV06_01505 [candidate division Zixibacteria bacterium]|nr:hypothetical protein [candidate division Zixibacteria bacterium]
MTRFYHILIITIILVMVCPLQTEAHLISNTSYPSEEELFEAYLQGDIDYQTYLNLVEIFEAGLDSSDQYLLNEIPGISYLGDVYIEDYLGRGKGLSDLPGGKMKNIGVSGSIKIRRYQEISEGGLGKNRYRFKSSTISNWSWDVLVGEDEDGRREWTKRLMQYKSRRGWLRKLVIGNFTAHYGLGLTVGYRGKLLHKATLPIGDSPLFPDFGGFNGLSGEIAQGHTGLEWFLHYDQDGQYRFRTAALNLKTGYKKWKGEGIFLGSVIQNRNTKQDYKYYQGSVYFQYRDSAFHSEMEMAFPQNTAAIIPAIVMESEYRTEPIKLGFYGWHYDRDFKNLTGGGRSGYYYNTVSIDTIDFSFSDRRNGQQGFLVRAIASLTNNVEYQIAYSPYGENRYERAARMSMSLEAPLSSVSRGKLDYKYKEENKPDGVVSGNELRAEYRLNLKELFLRSYLGYEVDRYGKNYLSYFIKGKIFIIKPMAIEVWLNFDKINIKNKILDYFYGYIREDINPLDNFKIGLKYSYRYNRNNLDHGQSALLIETEVRW